MDAMGCQREIATRIVNAGTDDVLAVRRANPGCLSGYVAHSMKLSGTGAPLRLHVMSGHRDTDTDHGRIEMRCCTVTDIVKRVWGPELWPGIRSIAMIEAPREIGDMLTTRHRYYVSSLPPHATRITRAIRSHCDRTR